MEQKDNIEQNIQELVDSDLTNTDSTEPDNTNSDVAEPNLVRVEPDYWMPIEPPKEDE